jgi:hypothetical protein
MDSGVQSETKRVLSYSICYRNEGMSLSISNVDLYVVIIELLYSAFNILPVCICQWETQTYCHNFEWISTGFWTGYWIHWTLIHSHTGDFSSMTLAQGMTCHDSVSTWTSARVIWVTTLCSLIGGYQHFAGMCCFHFQRWSSEFLFHNARQKMSQVNTVSVRLQFRFRLTECSQ